MKRHRSPSRQTFAVLTLLSSDKSRWRHGYEIAQHTGIASGTLYPILMRLTDRNYLESKWQMPGETRRPRHVYRLSTDGVAYVQSLATARAPSGLLPVGEFG